MEVAGKMTQTVAIYVLRHGMSAERHVHHALARLRAATDRLIVVAESGSPGIVRERLGDFGVDSFVFVAKIPSTLAGYRAGLLHLRETEDGAETGAVVLTSSAVFAPVGSIDERIAQLDPDGPAILAPYWYETALDNRLKGKGYPERLPLLDFAILSGRLLRHPAFCAYWDTLPELDNYWSEITVGLAGFAAMAQRENFRIAFACGGSGLGTVDPRITEIDTLLQRGAPCLPVAALHFDPLLHDLSASNLRAALDFLRAREPELYGLVTGYALHHIEPRRFAMIADQYQIVAEDHADPGKTWSFGPVAVFIHAYYTEMMPEFWTHIQKLPSSAILYISTATEEGVRDIAAFLLAKGRHSGQFEVRKVEQNRGRDMSALFITFRDIILEGRHEVALRLHSKRTPHMPAPVAEEFRRHMFDNIVCSEGFVRNILDMLEAEPDIGLVMPPVVHIGFGTLGHSWFGNRDRVAALAGEMGLNVVLDEHTPVAPYGTMYWFRTAALRRMFEWGWRWEHYNPEPNHIDGGLAHVQERLIGYCVQDAGYRILSVMSPQMAARNYAKLEYKLQALTGQLPAGSIVDQHRMLARENAAPVQSTYLRLRDIYASILRKYPSSRGLLRPVVLFLKYVVFFRARKT
jgi:lipopolysaccharide biosynthesis protein